MAERQYYALPSHPTQPPAEAGEHLPVSSSMNNNTTQDRVSLSSATSSLAKTMLGVGILALPRVTAVLGLGTTFICLAIIASLTSLSVHYLTLASARCGFLKYRDVARHYTKLPGQILLDASLVLNSSGLLVIAFVILGDILVGNSTGAGSSSEGSGLLSPACGDRSTVLAVLTVLIIAPLVSVVNPRTVAGLSGLGVAAIIFWSVVSVLLFVIGLTNGTLHTLHWWPQAALVGKGFEAVVSVASTIAVLVVAYTCQMSLQHIMRDLEFERQVDRVSGMAVGISSLAFLAVGVCSYGLFGSELHADVLKNFTVDALQPLVWTVLAQAVFLAVRMSFLVSIVAIFPLHMIPLRDAFWKLFFRQQLQGPGLWLVTYALLALLYFIGVWITNIWEPLILLGSTVGVFIAFILPGVVAMKIQSRLTDPEGAAAGRVAGGAVLVLTGVLVFVFGVLRFIFFG